MTWQSVIEGALLELAVLSPAATAKPTDLETGLRRLKGQIALWSADGNLVPRIFEYPLVAPNPAKAKYLIGSGADADLATAPIVDLRAIKYLPAGYTKSYELDLVSYGALIDRTIPDGTRPDSYFFEIASPDCVLRLNCSSLPGETLTLVGYGYLASAITLAGETGLSAEYELGLSLDLAVALAPGFGVPLTRVTKDAATDAMRILRKRNRKRPTLRLDPGLGNMNYGADHGYGGYYSGRY